MVITAASIGAWYGAPRSFSLGNQIPFENIERSGTGLFRMRQTEALSDLILIVGPQRVAFNVHKIALALKSNYFLYSPPDERELELPAVDDKIMKGVLQFIYSEDFEWSDINMSESAYLFAAAVELSMWGLREAAEDRFCYLVHDPGFCIHRDDVGSEGDEGREWFNADIEEVRKALVLMMKPTRDPAPFGTYLRLSTFQALGDKGILNCIMESAEMERYLKSDTDLMLRVLQQCASVIDEKMDD